MAVIITNGTVIYNTGKYSVALTAASGPQELPGELEARLVSEGAAQYVNTRVTLKKDKQVPAIGVATGIIQPESIEPGVNLTEEENLSNGELDVQEKPEYSVAMKAAELRELMEECQLPFKVGMSKADMVAALDAYFGDEPEEDEETPPNIGVEDPVV